MCHDQIKALPSLWSLRSLKKKNFSDRSDHMKSLSSDRSDNNCCDIKSSISAIVVAAIAGEWFPYDRWTIFSAITAIVVIIWKPGLIYRNNHPPFLLNCYLYALQTYRTHSSKLRLLLVIANAKNVLPVISLTFIRKYYKKKFVVVGCSRSAQNKPDFLSRNLFLPPIFSFVV